MRRRLQTHRMEGVTLLELIVAMTAAMVLASIAIPGYNGYVTRARVARAVGDIGTISAQLYRWMSNTRSFPATLAEAGIDMTDPWGHAYEYTRVEGARVGDLRKDRNLHPINTDFDLYSRGEDGETTGALTAKKSQDDVIRANDGSFIGVAADY
jgi:general secretion pathway protein G